MTAEQKDQVINEFVNDTYEASVNMYNTLSEKGINPFKVIEEMDPQVYNFIMNDIAYNVGCNIRARLKGI